MNDDSEPAKDPPPGNARGDGRPGSELEALLPGALSGDARGWEDFVTASIRLVRAGARRATGAAPGASVLGGRGGPELDDVVQDVYLRLLARDRKLLRTFDPARARLSTWITLVARSVAIDAVRRKRLPAVGLDGAGDLTALDADPAADVARRVDADGDRLPADVPLDELSERQQLVIRLLFEDGRSVAEVAAILDVEAQTVRSAKHKALVRLRAHYESSAESGGASGSDPEARAGPGHR